jgi:hypothetical protein
MGRRAARPCGGVWMKASGLHWVTFCAHRKSPKKRMRGGFRFPPLLTHPLKRHKRGVRAPLGLPPRDRETGDQKRRFPRHRALMLCKFASLTNHTYQRAEREIDAATIRLRAIRTAVTINGQGFRHGKQITRAAALVFFLVTFSKVKKPPGAGRNPASPVPPRDENVWQQGSAPCKAVVFLLAQKGDRTAQAAFSCRFAAIHLELRQAFPLHSLRSASAMTLLMAELLIVHSRKVPASVSAPQGAHALSFRAKRGIPRSEAYTFVDGDSSALARLRMTGNMRACACVPEHFSVRTFNSHKPKRGAWNRRKHNSNMSDLHRSNDKQSGLSTQKGNYQKRSFWFSFW